MASNKVFRVGPVALTTTIATNILNPATAGGGVNGGSSSQYILLRHIRVLNKTGGAVTFTLYLGATTATALGTEVIGAAQSVAANSAYDYYGALRLDAADFLVGGASAMTSLVLSAEGEVGVAG